MTTTITSPATGVPVDRVRALAAAERVRYEAANPRSKALAARSAEHLMFGVPLHWMNDWATPFPLQVAHARGARLTDVDGHEHVDPAKEANAQATRLANNTTTLADASVMQIIGDKLK